MHRVAVDCRPLMRPNTGIGRYLVDILQNMARFSCDDVVYYLYVPDGAIVPHECLMRSDRFIIRYLSFKVPHLLWLHLVVPLYLAGDRITVFWGPNYACPLIRLARYKTVLTIHDAVFFRYPKTMKLATRLHNKFMLPLYSRMAHEIITDSEFSRMELVEALGISTSKINVVPLGTDIADEFTDTNDDGECRLTVLSVGTIEPRKNLERLVDAFSRLPDELKMKYRLVIAGGSGWSKTTPDEWFGKYGVEKTATYLGAVDDNKLKSLYRHAALFVLPSIYEGFGIPVLEAMSMGTPVICSFSGSLYEVAAKAVLYCDPFSTEDISRKMQLVLEDHELRHRLKEAGYLRAHAFSLREAARQTESVLTRMLTTR